MERTGEDIAKIKQKAMESARSTIARHGYARTALTYIALYGEEAADMASRLADGFIGWEGAEDCELICRRIAATVVELRHRAAESLSSGTAH